MSVLSTSMKFEEIRNDYDHELDDYMGEVAKAYSASLIPYDVQDEDEEEILYKRTIDPSLGKRLIEYLGDSGGLNLEAQEAIECLEQGLQARTRWKMKVWFPERIYRWLREQREYIKAYLNGRYVRDVEAFFR